MEKTLVSAYLERIHAGSVAAADEETLNRLIISHLRAVPFENLDVIDFGRIPELDFQKLYDKIVKRRRGGYCFELNLLFEHLLAALGYDVYPVAMRVVWNRDYLPPTLHMGLVVVLQGKKYFCDVGFGGPGPKGLLALEPSEQCIEGEWFRVRLAEDGDFLLERCHHGEWGAVLRFEDRPVREPDLQLMNFYCSRNETTLFARTRVVNLCTPGGSKALTDRELTVRENGEERHIRYDSDAELEEGLAREFGLFLAENRERPAAQGRTGR